MMKKKIIILSVFILLIVLLTIGTAVFVRTKFNNTEETFLERFSNVTFQNLYKVFSSSEIVDEKDGIKMPIQKPLYSKLDGMFLLQEEEAMIGAMIENHPDSRPQQRGLSKASIVYEAEAEGGITRFLAIYSYQNFDKIGPIRSARPYFLSWAKEYNGGYAHAGGSPDALDLISRSGLINLEGLYYEKLGNKYFFRDKKYYAPHNLFANLINLKDLVKEKKENPLLENFRFRFGLLPADSWQTRAKEIDINFSEHPFAVKYVYDEIKQNYARFLAGKPHLDHIDETQITPTNLIVQVTSYYPIDEKGRLEMSVQGKGKAYFFTQGAMDEGTWEKEGKNRTMYYDRNGKEIIFKRGQTWISVVKSEKMESWK